MRTNLGLDDLGDFLTQPRLATLATIRADNTVLLSPIWFEWRDNGFNLWMESDKAKAKHLRREPLCTILVAEETPPMRAIEVRGVAQFIDTDVTETATRIAAKYIGADGAAEYARALQGTDVIVRIEADAVRIWDFADGVGAA